MKKNILKITAIFGFATIALTSCSDENPPLVWFPDMYYPVAYDPLQKAELAYSDAENDIPLFATGATGLVPVDGSVPQNKDGIVEANELTISNVEKYNIGYEASKGITASPLDPKNLEKDLERGKDLYDKTCSACHGTGGDGLGPIVQSGAYSGVPKYADRVMSIGSVHYVLTNGRNAMGSYAGQLNAGDRWRVSLYVMNSFKGAAAAAPAEATATTEVTTNTNK